MPRRSPDAPKSKGQAQGRSSAQVPSATDPATSRSTIRRRPRNVPRTQPRDIRFVGQELENDHSSASTRWTQEQLDQLLQMRSEGRHHANIAATLGRTPLACRLQLFQHNRRTERARLAEAEKNGETDEPAGKDMQDADVAAMDPTDHARQNPDHPVSHYSAPEYNNYTTRNPANGGSAAGDAESPSSTSAGFDALVQAALSTKNAAPSPLPVRRNTGRGSGLPKLTEAEARRHRDSIAVSTSQEVQHLQGWRPAAYNPFSQESPQGTIPGLPSLMDPNEAHRMRVPLSLQRTPTLSASPALVLLDSVTIESGTDGQEEGNLSPLTKFEWSEFLRRATEPSSRNDKEHEEKDRRKTR
ncbi:thymidylate synthase [Sphaceloma murrayae]|uniref:Thymidylate synthase n=1 Tax=Sphaceloma murrayae TaxID=2082308 RepID=A0A2K1QLD7_9PEZI|nr:thymidylate synthase [Sphaceloma murrayae]